jgi:arylsulfatase A-like enzyme
MSIASDTPGSAREERSSRPNLLVIVLDCARSPEFSVGSAAVSRMPTCSQLARESIDFRRTVAPASWTIPSHASLFTGLYPWDHRLHSRGLSHLPAELPTLAGELERAGYHTGSFSSNPFVGDSTGLTESFSTAAWGGWWERYARHLRIRRPPGGRRVGAGPPALLQRMREGPLWTTTLSAARAALRRPLVLHGTNRLLRSVGSLPGECYGCVSPWIESALSGWLSAQPASEPVLAFVNLMETHEPYMLPSAPRTWAQRWSELTVRQDFGDWLEGRWSPSPRELAVLHEMYVESICAVDHRIAAIVEIFRQAGRWDSTALVLTSDHGQGLGEEGFLSHGMSVADSITRVPLWLRLPGGERGGTATDSWCSLIDVVPTLLPLAGLRAPAACEGVNLLDLVDGPRTGPVWSMAEAVVSASVRTRLEPSRLDFFDRVRVAGYFDDTKVSSDGSGEIASVQRVPGIGRATGASDPVPAEMIELLREHLLRIASNSAAGKISPDDVLHRIESWGYA